MTHYFVPPANLHIQMHVIFQDIHNLCCHRPSDSRQNTGLKGISRLYISNGLKPSKARLSQVLFTEPSQHLLGRWPSSGVRLQAGTSEGPQFVILGLSLYYDSIQIRSTGLCSWCPDRLVDTRLENELQHDQPYGIAPPATSTRENQLAYRLSRPHNP